MSGMSIAWNLFTPWQSLAGGILIGIAATLLILFNGRIAGVSGILGGLFSADHSELRWRLLFLLGLMSAPILYGLITLLPAVEITTGNTALVLAGLLVGIGSRYGAGCTSGHGVCGLSRLSRRSLVATLCFMLSGFATVYVVRHLLGL